jgi:hypothetical protein
MLLVISFSLTSANVLFMSKVLVSPIIIYYLNRIAWVDNTNKKQRGRAGHNFKLIKRFGNFALANGDN